MLNMDPGLISKAGETGIQAPFAAQKSLYEMQNAMQQHKMQQQLGAGGFDQDETLSYLARFDPAAAMKASAQSRVAGAQEAKYGASAALDEQKAKVEELKQSQAQVDVISKVAGGISDQASYTSAMGYLRSQGIDVSEMPATYDPALVKSKADMALEAKDKLKLQIDEYRAQVDADYKAGQLGLGAERNASTADYQSLLAGQGQQRVDNDYDLRGRQIDASVKANESRLATQKEIAEAKLNKSGLTKSNKRVINQGGHFYIIDPDAATAQVATRPDGKPYQTAEMRANFQRTKQIATTLTDAKGLLDAGIATSGGLQSTLAGVARFGNYTTKGMADAAKLKTLSAWLTSNTPRMEGPQSDKDVKLYAEMAGMLGDEERTVAERHAAYSALVRLNRKYWKLNK